MTLEMFCHDCGEDLEIDANGAKCSCGELTVTRLAKCSIKPLAMYTEFDGSNFAPNYLLIASSRSRANDMAIFLGENGEHHVYQIDIP